jgi:2-phosphosulfolactate phosphatase
MQIEVAILPQETTRLSSRVMLVIDVIRATTSLVTLFERGARSVTLAPDIAAAREEGQARPEMVLVGESGGLVAPGFAFSNSPVELARAGLADRDLVFTTSNGARALRAVAGARTVLAACMRNGRSAARSAYTLARELDADIGIVCAGRARCTLVGQDDVICAGYLVEQLLACNAGRVAPWQPDADFADAVPAPPLDGGLDLDDSAALARRLYRSVVADPLHPQTDEIARVFAESAVGQGLERLGLAHDTIYCAAVDTSAFVPRLSDQAVAPAGKVVMIAAREAM